MAIGWRAMRRRVLTPDISSTKLATRGFHVKNRAARDLLETTGEMFLTGYAYAAEARRPADAERRLEDVPARFRGFAYEGAGMAFAIRDGLPLGGGGLLPCFLAGAGAGHVYMVYVGAGWALARLPRFRWAKVSASVPDPMLRWLVLDGYGFHQAYFHTGKYVHGQFRHPRFPWPADGPAWYANRVIDQGIGRAMWFVGGSDVDVVADLIDRFPSSRHADLYSGAGLAATYAGGVDEAELLTFKRRARDHLPQLAQAGAFAATARVRAGLVTPHTELATRLLCGTTPELAAELTEQARVESQSTGVDLPSFEIWRQRVASRLAGSSRATS